METSAHPNTPPLDFGGRPSTAQSFAGFFIPFLLLIAASLLIRWKNLDLIVARSLWSGDWRLKDFSGVEFLYDFGCMPALTVGAIGLGLWLASFWITRWRRTRRFGLYLFLCLAMGPGLLVNIVFKENFGRPRPREIMEFGGPKEFRALGEKPFIGRGKSFPSGHTAMGFFWLAPCIYFWRQQRKLAWAFAALALVQGGLMGVGRMAQGGHWFSDVVWSAGFVYLTSWLLWLALTGVNHLLVSPADHNLQPGRAALRKIS